MEISEFYTSLQSIFFPCYCLHSPLRICTISMNSQSKQNTYLSQYSNDCGLHDHRTWARHPVVAKQFPLVKYL